MFSSSTKTTFEVITLVYVLFVFVDAFGVFCFFKNQWEGFFKGGRGGLREQKLGGGLQIGGQQNEQMFISYVFYSQGSMLKGQEKQQQVIKNSKKCFVLFFSLRIWCLFVCCSGLRIDFYCEVDIYSTSFVIIFFSFIYQIKKRNFCCSIFVVFTGTLFTYYLDNNIGINRKITRNCFVLLRILFVCCCLFAKLCLSFEVQRTVQCGRWGSTKNQCGLE